MHRVTPTGLPGSPSEIQTDRKNTPGSEPERTNTANPQIQSMHTYSTYIMNHTNNSAQTKLLQCFPQTFKHSFFFL